MRNKEKAFDILNEEMARGLTDPEQDDTDANMIEQMENSIMEKLEKRIDDKIESYKASVDNNVDNVDNTNSNNSSTDNDDNVGNDNGGNDNGDN